MNQEKPSIGRIVHFRLYDNDCFAAIVTYAHGHDLINLEAFDNGSNRLAARVHTSVPYGSTDYTWHWPERV